MAAPLPRSVPDADRGVIYEFAMDTKIRRERDQLHRYEGHVDAAPRLGHISARSWALRGILVEEGLILVGPPDSILIGSGE
jgi:hypothetical protein